VFVLLEYIAANSVHIWKLPYNIQYWSVSRVYYKFLVIYTMCNTKSTYMWPDFGKPTPCQYALSWISRNIVAPQSLFWSFTTWQGWKKPSIKADLLIYSSFNTVSGQCFSVPAIIISNKMDFNFCAYMEGFPKSSHIYVATLDTIMAKMQV